MTLEQAIKKAIEGGLDVENSVLYMSCRLYLLDPLFWQSLGKAMGWEEKIRTYYCWGCNTGEVEKRHEGCQCRYKISWRYHWYSFIDHLAQKKSAESWFEQFKT